MSQFKCPVEIFCNFGNATKANLLILCKGSGAKKFKWLDFLPGAQKKLPALGHFISSYGLI